MSTEEGTITKVAGHKAWVRVRRSSMCENCSSKGICTTIGGGESMESEALNTANGSVGDRVLLRIPQKSLLKISFVFYMVPVIFLIAGIIAGMKIGKTYFPDPELISMLSGIAACAASFIIIKIFAHRVRKNRDYMPEIVKII